MVLNKRALVKIFAMLASQGIISYDGKTPAFYNGDLIAEFCFLPKNFAENVIDILCMV